MSEWETIIGLEIHCELNTKSKLFSTALNHFGDEPNTNISEVCTGQPGALPVLNKEAVYKAVRLGCALNAKVANFSKFDRKSYFYPDSPRNFQITQFDEPIVIGGSVVAEVEGKEKTFELDRAHLEDDAGMLKHFGEFAGVDYNRAGVPLIEIVSTPCIRSAKEATAYAMAIRAILQYIDASDCNMQEGSLRFDVNISIRKKGEEGFRPKSEIKNLNSFSNMEKAIESEIEKQIRFYTDQPEGVLEQATYRYDPEKKEVILMRRKEYAEDYRYFPEPDLVPIILSDEYIEKIRKGLPELPFEREKRYIEELSMKPQDAFLIVSDKAVADYFEKALKLCKNGRALYNWIIVEFPGRLRTLGKTLPETEIYPENIAKLINFIDSGKITGKIAKCVADEMVKNLGKDCEEIINENPDYTPLSDTLEIEQMVDKVLLENPQSIEDFKAGKDKAFAFLVGQVMKLSRGKASPKIVNDLINNKINK